MAHADMNDYEALKQSMNQILTHLGLDPANLPSGSYSEIVIGAMQARDGGHNRLSAAVQIGPTDI